MNMKIPERIARTLYWQNKRFRGHGVIKKRLDWLLKTQWMGPGEIRALQFKKLHRVIEHAFQTVPYYRRIMEERALTPYDITDFNDLRKLPLLTRDILRTQQEVLLSSEADHATLQTNFSSGSTGARAEFKQDLNFRMWMRAHQLRTYGWCSDWQLGEPFVLLWGSEIYWSFKQFSDYFENVLSNRREFNTFRLSDTLIKKVLKQLTAFQPVLVSTYTNAMHLLAREARRQHISVKALRAVQGTSEPLPPPIRAWIAEVFECEVYDKYGMRETNIVSHESPQHDGMLIQAENVFVEFLRTDTGQPCKDGETGKLVITTLNNLSMPLIRYETADLASPLSGYSKAGFGLPRMTSVAGRRQDLIVTPRGDFIDAYFFSYLIMRFEEIHWFQVVQREEEQLDIRLYAPSGLSADSRAALVERIHHHTGYPFRIEFEMLSAMPPSSTGKFRLCVSELAELPTPPASIQSI